MTEKQALVITPAMLRGLGHVTKGINSLDLPMLPLAIGGALAIPYFARRASQDVDKEYNVSQRFNDAQARGEAPMSESFDSFVQQRRKHGHEKKAKMGPPAVVAGSSGDVLKRLFMRRGDVSDVTEAVDAARRASQAQQGFGGPPAAGGSGALEDYRALWQRGEIKFDEHTGRHLLHEHDQLSLGRALGTLGALGTAGVGYNALTTAPDNPLQHRIQNMVYGPHANVRMEDEFLRGLSHQGGKETAGLVRQLVEQTTGQAADAAKSIPRGIQQSHMLQNIVQSDDMLRDATPQDQELLGRAYQTMQKFAPELASDEFAVRNYLREALMAANGPDYATISNLARANRDITDQGRR